jgi:predicted RNase H-like HicB family nuclease
LLSLKLIDVSDTIEYSRTEGSMEFRIEFDREEDGRWIADIPELPGVMAYGTTQEEAKAKSEALALRVLADRIEETKKAVPSVVFA